MGGGCLHKFPIFHDNADNFECYYCVTECCNFFEGYNIHDESVYDHSSCCYETLPGIATDENKLHAFVKTSEVPEAHIFDAVKYLEELYDEWLFHESKKDDPVYDAAPKREVLYDNWSFDGSKKDDPIYVSSQKIEELYDEWLFHDSKKYDPVYNASQKHRCHCRVFKIEGCYCDDDEEIFYDCQKEFSSEFSEYDE